MFKKTIETLVNIFNDGAYINIAINNGIINSKFDDKEKRLYTKLVYGVVENKLLLDYYLQPLISGKRVKPFIKNALRVGVYGLDFLNIADYYIVDSIVSVVKKKDYKASSFVNAILRKYQKEPKRSLEKLPKIDYLSIKYSIDKNLVELLYKQYGNLFESFFDNSDDIYNTYRINMLKATVENVEKYLKDNNIDYLITNEVILQTKVSLINTILFKEGLVVAQDKSSIMVGLISNAKPYDRILDACSAPGSKTMHFAAITNNTSEIISLDVHEHKLKLIEENANKLGVTCIKPMLADATKVVFNEPFDLVLADVPCSGLGVIRHKPDLKYQMTCDKIESIKVLQKNILENVATLVKKGGTLIYSTCTINKDENENLINEFLNKNPHLFKEEELIMLPSSTEDGFYICKIRGF